ncbi:hypothetical protein BGZ96_007881 [Linnemannia gamsii]|uniref:Ubiquitin-like domain-containing protein n=1 Tax=Linnemannia gamsii TaxID=64522 RepID=A0ABQ7K0Z2_9FUNG|nr:hypothetical protein BGZ96_007881 [Linnemannia gamsii]
MSFPDTIEVMLADKPGKRVKVLYTANEPVYNIVRRIAMELQELKADYNYQELYLGGFHLEYPHLPFDNYRVLGGTLTYQSFKRGDMSALVKTLTERKNLCIGCNPSDTILALKKILFKREGTPLAQIKLQYKGKALDDDDTLESRGIDRLSTLTMSTLTMSTPVLDGLRLDLFAPMKFADVSNSANATTVKLVSKLSQHNFECPNCEDAKKTVPVTVGFRTCKYRFHGFKAGGTQRTTGWTKVEGSDKYQYFDPKKQIGWIRLVIESTPLNGEDACPLFLTRMVNKVKTLIEATGFTRPVARHFDLKPLEQVICSTTTKTTKNSIDCKKQAGRPHLVIELAPLDGMDDFLLCLGLMVDNVTTLDYGHLSMSFVSFGME